MTDKCTEVRDVLALEGKVPLGPNDATLREHLEGCVECASFLKSLSAVEAELGALPAADVEDDVVAALLSREELKGRTHVRRSRHWAMGLAAAAVIGFIAVRVSVHDQPEELFLADLKQPRREAEMARLRNLPRENGEGDNIDLETENGRFRELDSLGSLADKDAAVKFEDAPKKQDAQSVSPPLPASRAAAPREGKESVRRLDERKGGFDTPALSADEEIPVVVGGAVVARDNVLASRFDPDLLHKRRSIEKLVHVDPVLPEGAGWATTRGTVGLQIQIDRAGNVIDARVSSSIPSLDRVAIDAVMQWKYAPLRGDVEDTRSLDVLVEFDLEEQERNEYAAVSFLEARRTLEGLRFREARGYWANSYVPGDPKVRFIAARLAQAQLALSPHLLARPVAQPFDAPSRGALSVSIHADRRSLREPDRLLVQVGLKATTSHGRRRPPMNVGIVLDRDGGHALEMRALVEALQAMKAPGDRFRLILPGRGEVVAPDAFRHAPVLALSVAKLRFARNGEPNRHAFHDVGLAVHQMAGFSVEAARTTYAIPEGFEPVTAIALGYSAEEAPVSRTRRPQDDIVFHGQWETPY